MPGEFGDATELDQKSVTFAARPPFSRPDIGAGVGPKPDPGLRTHVHDIGQVLKRDIPFEDLVRMDRGPYPFLVSSLDDHKVRLL